jgi:hypothetical protein
MEKQIGLIAPARRGFTDPHATDARIGARHTHGSRTGDLP